MALNLSHPLYGADIKTLMAILWRSGGVKLSKIPLVVLIILAAIGRLPFTAVEYIWVKFNRAKIIESQADPAQAPIFIIGHWRSGTTHLYNMLSKSDRFGYVTPFSTALPWDILLIGKIFAPILRKSLPEGRYIDNVKVESDSPQEDEIALANMTWLSYYQAIYFPKKFDHYFWSGVFFDGVSDRQKKRWEKTLKYLYLKLSLDQKGKRLLIKNPAYTARVAQLRRIYPHAKFIHIHRNPYKVFVSMQNFYKKLFPQFALQNYDQIDIDAVVFKTYRRMMSVLKDDVAKIPSGHYIDIAFDDLQSDPLGQIKRIYTALNLEGFSDDGDIFQNYLDSIVDYKKNNFDISEPLKAKIDKEWAHEMRLWGYQPS